MKKLFAIGLVVTLGFAGIRVAAWAQQANPGSQASPFGANQSPYQNYQGEAALLYNRAYSQNFFQPGNGEAEKLARQLAKAKTDGERENIRAKLNDMLEKQFDERQKKHKAESEALETQVKKLKELIATRNENRHDIISRRLDQMVKDAQGLGW